MLNEELKYEENIHFQLKMKNIFVQDNETTLKTIKVKDKINECETTLSIIPNGLAWRLQL